jgi:hypothetical protein
VSITYETEFILNPEDKPAWIVFVDKLNKHTFIPSSIYTGKNIANKYLNPLFLLPFDTVCRLLFSSSVADQVEVYDNFNISIPDVYNASFNKYEGPRLKSEIDRFARQFFARRQLILNELAERDLLINDSFFDKVRTEGIIQDIPKLRYDFPNRITDPHRLLRGMVNMSRIINFNNYHIDESENFLVNSEVQMNIIGAISEPSDKHDFFRPSKEIEEKFLKIFDLNFGNKVLDTDFARDPQLQDNFAMGFDIFDPPCQCLYVRQEDSGIVSMNANWSITSEKSITNDTLNMLEGRFTQNETQCVHDLFNDSPSSQILMKNTLSYSECKILHVEKDMSLAELHQQAIKGVRNISRVLKYNGQQFVDWSNKLQQSNVHFGVDKLFCRMLGLHIISDTHSAFDEKINDIFTKLSTLRRNLPPEIANQIDPIINSFLTIHTLFGKTELPMQVNIAKSEKKFIDWMIWFDRFLQNVVEFSNKIIALQQINWMDNVHKCPFKSDNKQTEFLKHVRACSVFLTLNSSLLCNSWLKTVWDALDFLLVTLSEFIADGDPRFALRNIMSDNDVIKTVLNMKMSNAGDLFLDQIELDCWDEIDSD